MGKSQDFCRLAEGSTGGGSVWSELQMVKADLMRSEELGLHPDGRMRQTNSEHPAAEARKAEGAS